MKRILITLVIGIMLGYMLCLVHQLAQKTNCFKMETTTHEVQK